MKTSVFEKAIEALGVNGLEVTKFSYGVNGQVVAVYAQMGESTFLMWDRYGRGFSISLNFDLEGVEPPRHPEYLNYDRDADFNLKFDCT